MAGCQSATQPKGRAKASAKGKAQAAASKGRGKPGSNRKRLTAPSSQSYRSKKRCCARLFAPALPSFSVFPFTLSFLFPFPFPFLCLFFFPLLFTFSFPFFFRSFPSLPFPSILLAFPFTLRFPGLFLSLSLSLTFCLWPFRFLPPRDRAPGNVCTAPQRERTFPSSFTPNEFYGCMPHVAQLKVTRLAGSVVIFISYHTVCFILDLIHHEYDL